MSTVLAQRQADALGGCVALRTADIDAACAQAKIDPGAVHPMARGDYRWRITIPDDGALRKFELISARTAANSTRDMSFTRSGSSPAAPSVGGLDGTFKLNKNWSASYPRPWPGKMR